tara:strand:- start:726 stop:1313 length:588 start_codon:yes stop_codon:yes gene_type:complete
MNKILYVIVPGILLLGFGANWVIQKANNSHDIPVIKQVPDFTFHDQDGQLFNKTRLANKITVLDFMFTSCTGPCPLMSSNMATLYQEFQNVKEVQFVSVTVDPITDSEKALKEYAEFLGVNDDRWQFIRSDLESTKDLKQGGFMLYAGELPQGHAIKFILLDHKGNIRKYFDGTDDASQAVLRKDIATLVKGLRS